MKEFLMNEKIRYFFIGIFTCLACMVTILFRKNKHGIDSDVGKEFNKTGELCEGLRESSERERQTIEGIKSTTEENRRIIQELKNRANNGKD